MESNVMIQAKSLNLYYGTKQALFDVNVSIPKGKVTALIGPSGCGKSTFLRCLNRMNDLIETVKMTGEIHYADVNILHKDIDVVSLRQRVGMIFQKSNPFNLSIYENIAYGPRFQGQNSKANLDVLVEECLRKAALWDEVKDRLNSNAIGLSGGQQQRLCIARALSLKPEVLLMDEPTSALDPISTAKIEDLVSELAHELSIIIVTHNMQQASRVSNQTAFFYEGQLVEFGDTTQVFTNPKEKRTEDYITGRFS